jgi:arylsulfatase
MMCAVVFVLGCGGPAPLTVDMPLHLEEHLDAATIEGSEVPADLVESVEWRFDEPQPDWRPAEPIAAQWEAVEPVRVDDALRLPLIAANRGPNRMFGMIYVDLPDWKLENWGYVEIRARTRDPMLRVGLAFNYTEEDDYGGSFPFYSTGDRAPLVTDGTVQTYRLSLDFPQLRSWEGPWTHLAIWCNSQDDAEAVTLDILSVRVIPREAEFAADRVGVRMVRRGTTDSRQEAPRTRSLFLHAPGKIAYRVRVPKNGRLDVGLGVLGEDAPVTFGITTTLQDGTVETLLEETHADPEHWGQRSVDLSHLAGQTVTLALEAEAARAGTVALWAAPTLSGPRSTDRPNVIFYVIDGGAADYMSVYGYNRRTTPHLERLAEEGAVFEYAYSNSTWSKPSTMSFMTSLQHSVLGGHRSDSDPLPEQAVTMAEHMHRAGYQTAVLTGNPYAGTMSSLDRGVDLIRDSDRGGNSVSSVSQHGSFWRWRETSAAEPYWVHFQTSDVHFPWSPVAPVAGLFLSPESRERYDEWERKLRDAGIGVRPASADFAGTGISPAAHYDARRRVYDEAMAHQDHQLGRLVERLKAADEWEHTLLIVAADHSHAAAGLLDPSAPRWGPLLRSSQSRVPLIIVWPGRIAPGQRFRQPVSMIDVLPTILDLVRLPKPEMMQGQSLAPLLLGEEGWVPRPVILEELYVDQETGELSGAVAMIDGRWGASLAINPDPEQPFWEEQRPAPLLVCDRWNDPMCLRLDGLHEEHPDLVEKYTAFLEAQWEAHQALAQLFTPSGSVALTPEQLETLRALGYIQ